MFFGLSSGGGRYYKLIQGALLIMLGVMILLRPEVVLITLALIVATVLIVIGVLNIFWAWSSGPRR